MTTEPKKRIGRPPMRPEQRRQMRSFRMSPDIVRWLAAQENETKAIEDIIRRSKSFRDWEKLTQS